MSAQTNYSFKTAAGAAGGIVDLAPYKIDTFLNKENTGVMKFGYGVIRHSGNVCKLPVGGTTADKFLGITVNNRSTEFDMEGNIHIRNKAALGVMRYGRVYARVAHGLTIAAGDKLYLIISGDDAGKFTNVLGGTSIVVSGVFDGPADANDIASVTLYNAPTIDNDTIYTLPNAGANTLGGVKVGTGLSIDANGVLSADGYTLPAATDQALGGVKVGTGLDVAEDGTISVHQG